MNRQPILHSGRWIFGAAAVVLQAACTLGPDYVRPAPPQEQRYLPKETGRPAAENGADLQHLAYGAAPPAEWWRLFGSTRLDAVVRQALANNPSAQAAEASLRQSEDLLRAGQGVFYPQVDLAGSALRQRSAPAQQGLSAQGSVFNLVTLSTSVHYLIDLFGAERRQIEGLGAETDDRRALTRAAYLTLSGNVVNACIARAAYLEQIRVTEDLLRLQEAQLQTAEVQYRAGIGSYAAVLGARTVIAANRASLSPLRQKANAATHLLAALAGLGPAEEALPVIGFQELRLPRDVPVSLPSELVRQRPDILSAEARMHAANAAIGVATAAMYPALSLTADYGAGASSLARLGGASARFWSIGPALSLPIFQGGTLWYGRAAAVDALQASQAVYRQTVLEAFAQVADALTALGHDAQATAQQGLARQAAADALALVQVSYQAGVLGFSDVLVADVLDHQAAIALVQAQAQGQQDTVALLLASGGGWSRPLSDGRMPP